MNPQSKSTNSEIRNVDLTTGGLTAGGLATSDVAKARAFYDGLLAWEFRELTPEFPQAGYLPGNSGHTGGGQGRGGAMALEPARGGVANRPPYFQVDDLDAVAARVWELGGEIVVPPTATPGGPGSFCIVRDPCGAAIGLWQARAAESSAV